MISEGSCDTVDWSNVAETFSFAITGIRYLCNCNKNITVYSVYAIK